MSYADVVRSDSPEIYWRLSEASGTTAGDGSGNNRSGTFSGTYTRGVTGLVPGDRDPASSFAGGNITINYDSAYMNSSAFTAEAIINPTSSVSGFQTFWSRYNVTFSTSAFTFRLDSNQVAGYVFIGSSLILALSTSTVSVGNTYHVAMTYDGTSARVYLNGVQDGNIPTGTMNASTFNLTAGKNTGGSENFVGVLDEMAYYSTCLSPARIAAHYRAMLRSGVSY